MIYIIEFSTTVGVWCLSDYTGYTSKKEALETAIKLMEASQGRMAARVKELRIKQS